jgi:hypothetical protein
MYFIADSTVSGWNSADKSTVSSIYGSMSFKNCSFENNRFQAVEGRLPGGIVDSLSYFGYVRLEEVRFEQNLADFLLFGLIPYCANCTSTMFYSDELITVGLGNATGGALAFIDGTATTAPLSGAPGNEFISASWPPISSIIQVRDTIGIQHHESERPPHSIMPSNHCLGEHVSSWTCTPPIHL